MSIFLLVAGIVAAAYWPGLSGNWLLDDKENLRHIFEFEKGLTSWQDAVLSNPSGPTGRPLAMLTFAANQLASGGDIFAYKYTNLMLHLLTGTLLFWLTGRLFALLNKSWPWLWAVFVAALWLTTPIQSSTVLYTIQRMAQLSALFSVAGMLCYIVGRERLATGQSFGIPLILSAPLMWLPLGALSKESALLLPVFLLLLELHFFPERSPREKNFLIALAGVFLLLPLLLALYHFGTQPHRFLSGYNARDFSFTERLLTESRVLFHYLKNILLPDVPALGIIHDDFTVSRSLLSPPTTLLAILGWLCTLGLAAYMYGKRQLRALAFGIFFFVTAHLLESSIFALELYFEHRNYLATWAVMFALAALLGILIRSKNRIRILLPIGLSLTVIYAFATYQRAQTWSSPKLMLLSAAIAHPLSPRVNNAMAYHHMRLGEKETALKYLDVAERVASANNLTPYIYRLAAYCWDRTSAPEMTYDALDKRLKHLGTQAPSASWSYSFKLLAKTAQQTGCRGIDPDRLQSGIAPWFNQLAKTHAPDNMQPLCTSIGHMFHRLKRDDLAAAYLDHCMNLDPPDVYAGLLKLRYQLSARKTDEARKTLQWLQAHHKQSKRDYSVLINGYAEALKE